MEVNTNDSNVKIVDASKIDIIWTLFKEYHHEVSSFAAEQALTSDEKFKSFWNRPDKLAILLYSGEKAVGPALMQEVEAPDKHDNYLEIGAVFVKKEFRKGLNGVRLYHVISDIGEQLSLPIASEVAGNNHLSLKLARLLAKRYIRQKGTGVLEETKLENGRHFMCFYNSRKTK